MDYSMQVLDCCDTLHGQSNGSGETMLESSDKAATFLRKRLAEWSPYNEHWAGYEALVHALIVEALREYDAWRAATIKEG